MLSFINRHGILLGVAALLWAAMFSSSAISQSASQAANCTVTTAAPSYTNGTIRSVSCDTSGNTRVTGTITVTPSGTQNVNVTQVGSNAVVTAGVNGLLAVGGNAAAAATDSGQPVKIGCKYNSTKPTYTDGQRSDCQSDTKGNTTVALYGADSAAIAAGAMADGISNGANALYVNNRSLAFNGASWDRVTVCPSFAAISVTAGNTTQIIGLSGSTVIRICNITLSTSLTGTFTLLSGTGTNCGTPANSTGAIGITTAMPWSLGDGSAPVYRGSAGGEFCVAAATGNITGWVMYAQY